MELLSLQQLEPDRGLTTSDEREPLDFPAIMRRAHEFADFIEGQRPLLEETLLRYESNEVVVDETRRTLELLRDLHENAEYFQRRIGPVTAFLPRNQPLYALACFGLVPSFMATEVHVKAPRAMDTFFHELTEALRLAHFFPNVHISRVPREAFVQQRSATRFNLTLNRQEPVTDCVIFTGTMANGDKLRKRFRAESLFIANGSGHNPIIVTDTANLEDAVFGAMRVQLYNSGQDCASPNVVLVHEKLYPAYITRLREALREVGVGPYADRANRVGPLSDARTLLKVQETFIDNARWLCPSTPGVIRTRDHIIEPTLILKPLETGGNYQEQFAPVFFVQRYTRDDMLGLYFEDPRYARHAMYVTVFGQSDYVDGRLLSLRYGGRPLHDETTLIRNTDLHAEGVERGTQPYGGFGRGASYYSIHGTVVARPTLPQRDIYEQLVSANRPRPPPRARRSRPKLAEEATVPGREAAPPRLLDERNATYAARLSAEGRVRILALRELLLRGPHSAEQLRELLYELPKSPLCSEQENTRRQRDFFSELYNLLFGLRSGPRLASFLWTAEPAHLARLLDV
jgi:lysyl-tRNA synthetase class 1